jgi:hypothetical protein
LLFALPYRHGECQALIVRGAQKRAQSEPPVDAYSSARRSAFAPSVRRSRDQGMIECKAPGTFLQILSNYNINTNRIEKYEAFFAIH